MTEQSDLPVKIKPRKPLAFLPQIFKRKLGRDQIPDTQIERPRSVLPESGKALRKSEGYHPEQGLGYYPEMVTTNPGNSEGSIQASINYKGTEYESAFSEAVEILVKFRESAHETGLSQVMLPQNRFYRVENARGIFEGRVPIRIAPNYDYYEDTQMTRRPNKYGIGSYYFFADEEKGIKTLEIAGASFKDGLTEVLRDINKIVDVAREFTPNKSIVTQENQN